MTTISPATIERMRACRIIPVITIKSLDQALPLANALIAGGADVLEVTLRTDCALDAIRQMADAGLDAFVGAGTITRPSDVDAAARAGAEFLVTPGTTETLRAALKSYDGAVFPGVATVSEALSLRDEGFAVQKFFPAEASGGAPFLKSIAAPVPDIQFMPTGGVNPQNARDYLSLPNVIAVGGSWIVPNDLIEAGKWEDITTLTKTSRNALA
jgi:2-dehydro-3-deoxyphosphogluconate aldolase/(4S)-4-hydroxy-2-oxoglutarate aldolase